MVWFYGDMVILYSFIVHKMNSEQTVKIQFWISYLNRIGDSLDIKRGIPDLGSQVRANAFIYISNKFYSNLTEYFDCINNCPSSEKTHFPLQFS